MYCSDFICGLITMQECRIWSFILIYLFMQAYCRLWLFSLICTMHFLSLKSIILNKYASSSYSTLKLTLVVKLHISSPMFIQHLIEMLIAGIRSGWDGHIPGI